MIDEQLSFNDLTVEFEQWNQANHWTGRDRMTLEKWAHCTGNYRQLAGYGRILWPSFIEHDDCVFHLEGFAEKGYKEWLKHLRDKTRVEAMINHVHILDMFPADQDKPSRELVLYLGRLLKDVWQTKLNRDFPDRRIIVSFPEDYSSDLIDYEITFYQERN